MVKGERLGTAQRAERPRYRIEPVHGADRIRALLEPKRLFCAYAIGQLGPELLPLVECWHATEVGGGAGAVAVFSRGGLGNSLLTLGDAEPLAGILRLHPGPRRNYVTCEPRHLDAVRRTFRLTSERPMLRMAVARDSFVAPPQAGLGVEVRRMRDEDARYVNRLYNTEGAPTYYSGRHIETGAYFGVLVDRRLVAVAGTHVFSPEEGIAVVGNVFTHPQWRGRGHAQLATGWTTAWLLDRCRDVVLTVDPENRPAVRAYEHLGYRPVCRMIEASVTRRELTGLGSYFRRLRARLAAHEAGAEVFVH